MYSLSKVKGVEGLEPSVISIAPLLAGSEDELEVGAVGSLNSSLSHRTVCWDGDVSLSR
jgi:hypothetical protein